MFCKSLDITLILKWSGLTQSAFLKQTHMSAAEWNDYQSRECSVSLEHLIAIAHLLGVSIETLFTMEDGTMPWSEKGQKSRHFWENYQILLGLQRRLQERLCQERVETLEPYLPFLEKVAMTLRPPIFGFCSTNEKLLLEGVLEFLGTDTLQVYEFLSEVKKPVYILPDSYCLKRYTGKVTLLPFRLSPRRQHLWDILGNLSQEGWEDCVLLEDSPYFHKENEPHYMGYFLFLPCAIYPILGDVVFYFLPTEEKRGFSGSSRDVKVGPVDYGEDLLHRVDMVIHLGTGTLKKEELPVIHRCFMARLDREYPLGREALRGFGVCLLRKQEEQEESVCLETGEALLLKYFMARFWDTLQDRQYDRYSVETWVRESFWNYRFVQDGTIYDSVEVAEMFSSVLAYYWEEILPSYLDTYREEERRYGHLFYSREQVGHFFSFLERDEEETRKREGLEREYLSLIQGVHQRLEDMQEILHGKWNTLSSYEKKGESVFPKQSDEGPLGAYRDRMLPIHMDLSSLQKSLLNHGIFWSKLFLMREKYHGRLSIFQEDLQYLQEVSHKKSKEAREAQEILGYLAECTRRDMLRVSIAKGEKEEIYRGAIISGRELVLVVDGTLKTSLQDLLPKEKRGKSPPLLTLQGYLQWLSTL